MNDVYLAGDAWFERYERERDMGRIARQRKLQEAQERYEYARRRVDQLQEDLNVARRNVTRTEGELLKAKRENDGRVIQVMFGTSSPRRYDQSQYSYRVPDEFPDLEVGDFVITPPTRFEKMEQVAVVSALGRGDYTGPLVELAGYVIKTENLK